MSVAHCTSLITFRVREGREAAFVAAFDACGMLTRPRAIDGYVSGELIRQCEDGRNFAVIAHWTGPQACAAWRRVARSEALREFVDCLESTAPGTIWTPVRGCP